MKDPYLIKIDTICFSGFSLIIHTHTQRKSCQMNEKMLIIFASDFLPHSLYLFKNTLNVVISRVHQIRIHCMLQKNHVSIVNFSITCQNTNFSVVRNGQLHKWKHPIATYQIIQPLRAESMHYKTQSYKNNIG